jgi:hypothetical protein
MLIIQDYDIEFCLSRIDTIVLNLKNHIAKVLFQVNFILSRHRIKSPNGRFLCSQSNLDRLRGDDN